jgi:hypothetical protein
MRDVRVATSEGVFLLLRWGVTHMAGVNRHGQQTSCGHRTHCESTHCEVFAWRDQGNIAD